MKRDYLRSTLALVVGLVLSFTTIDAQTFDLNLSTATTSCQYCATVQIKSADTPFNLGGLSFVFSYNESALTYLTYASQNFDENTECDGDDGLYTAHQPFISGGQISSGVAPDGFSAFDGCPEIGSDWIDVAEICFDITDETQLGNLIWSDNPSQFIATTSQDLATPLSPGTFTNIEEMVICESGGGAEDTDTDGAGTDGAGTDGAGTDGAGTDGAGTDGAGTDGTGGDDCDIVITQMGFDCDEDAGEFTYTIMIAGGAPSGDPTATYDLSGSGFANPLAVFGKTMITLGPYTDGQDVSVTATDANGCAGTFTSGGPVACSKDEECDNPIVVTDIFDCNEEDAEFTYTFVLTGGAPGSDPLESYTVNGTGVNGAMVAAGGNLTVVYSDGTEVELTFTDSAGCETLWSSDGPVACSKDDCDDPVVITEVFDCDEDAGVFTFTFVLTGGAPGADPTEFYTVTGTNIGSPLMAFAGAPVVLSYADGTEVDLLVVDSNDCEAVFGTGDPIPCSKDTDTDSDSDSDSDGSDTDGSDTDGSDTDGSDTDGSDTDGSDTDGSDTDGMGCTPPVAASLLFQSGGTSANICLGLGQTVDVQVTSAPGGDGGIFVITDGSGSMILAGPVTPPFNFDGAPVGTCQIWHVAYEGDISIPASMMVADLEGCFSLSNPLNVIRDGAPSAPQIFETALGGGAITVCNNTGFVNDVTVGISSGGTGSTVEYILSDTAGNIVAGPQASPSFNFFGSTPGDYLITAVTYSGSISNGGTIATISGCLAFSNQISVVVLACDPPVVEPDCITINAAFITLAGTVCENSLLNSTAQVVSSNPSDVVVYVVSDQNGNVLTSSNSGVFAWNQIPGFQQNAYYYVTVQGGPDLNGDGFPDVNDPCFTAQQGPALFWADCDTPEPSACPTVSAGAGLSAVCPGGSANVTATITGQGGYAVAYVLHTSPTYAPSTVVATSFNGSFASPGANNVAYYSSVLVGTDLNNDGVPDANSQCYAVYNAQQVVFLSPISIAIASEQCDDDTGITTVAWVVTGGLPQFNSAATYTVTGSINQNVGYNQIFSTVFSDGETSALNVVDSFCGQSQSVGGGPYTCKDLPIDLLVFSGEVQGKGNLLYWVTATEVDNDFFTLERSFDGLNFEEITYIDGAGNSIVNIEYDYLDEDARPGVNYYRLRQTDFNNTNTVSETIELYREFDDNVTTISPVPAYDVITVSYEAANDVEVIMSVFDIIGRQVMAIEVDMEEGINNIDLGLDTIASGVYLLSIDAGGSVTTKKFIKN